MEDRSAFGKASMSRKNSGNADDLMELKQPSVLDRNFSSMSAMSEKTEQSPSSVDLR